MSVAAGRACIFFVKSVIECFNKLSPDREMRQTDIVPDYCAPRVGRSDPELRPAVRSAAIRALHGYETQHPRSTAADNNSENSGVARKSFSCNNLQQNL